IIWHGQHHRLAERVEVRHIAVLDRDRRVDQHLPGQRGDEAGATLSAEATDVEVTVGRAIREPGAHIGGGLWLKAGRDELRDPVLEPQVGMGRGLAGHVAKLRYLASLEWAHQCLAVGVGKAIPFGAPEQVIGIANRLWRRNAPVWSGGLLLRLRAIGFWPSPHILYLPFHGGKRPPHNTYWMSCALHGSTPRQSWRVTWITSRIAV